MDDKICFEQEEPILLLYPQKVKYIDIEINISNQKIALKT